MNLSSCKVYIAGHRGMIGSALVRALPENWQLKAANFFPPSHFLSPKAPFLDSRNSRDS